MSEKFSVRRELSRWLSVLLASCLVFLCDSFFQLAQARVDRARRPNTDQAPRGGSTGAHVGQPSPLAAVVLLGKGEARRIFAYVLAIDRNRDFHQVLEERDGSLAVTRSYIYGDDRISQDQAVTELSFYAYDGQMSTRQLTDETAEVTDTYDFDAFGVELARTGFTANNFLYAGEQLDPNSGFYYLRARYLNVAVGRFVSEDPISGIDADPLTLHKYLYVKHNPVTEWDPTGLGSFFNIIKEIAKTIIFAILRTFLRVAIPVAARLSPRLVPALTRFLINRVGLNTALRIIPAVRGARGVVFAGISPTTTGLHSLVIHTGTRTVAAAAHHPIAAGALGVSIPAAIESLAFTSGVFVAGILVGIGRVSGRPAARELAIRILNALIR